MPVLKQIAKRFFTERYFDQAAQIAYYLLLSVFPFLLFILSLISYFPVHEETILRFLRPYAPGDSYRLIEDNVKNILQAGKGQILSLSLLAAFWISSMALQAIARALNQANGYNGEMSFWKLLLRDLGMTVVFMLLIPVTLFLPFIESGLHWVVARAGKIDDWQGWIYVWPNVKWGLGTLFLFLFFLFFYKFVPVVRLKWREVWPGALLSAIGWQFVSFLFSDYVANVNYTRLYGQLSGVIVLVLWFYLTALVLLISGLLIAELKKVKSG